MKVLTRLERPLGWMAIGHLPIYVVTAQAIVYVWTWLNPGADQLLSLDPALVHSGEYWRVLTFLFVSPFQNPVLAFLYLYFQFLCGNALEQEWGSFSVTMFYFAGAVGAIAAAFIGGEAMHYPFFFNDSVFLAFAALYPDFSILLFLILPIKIKWIAWFTWARIAFSIWVAPGMFRVAILVSLLPYFLFFSDQHIRELRALAERIRHRQRYKNWNS